jgi:hypothetical protein
LSHSVSLIWFDVEKNAQKQVCLSFMLPRGFL